MSTSPAIASTVPTGRPRDRRLHLVVAFVAAVAAVISLAAVNAARVGATLDEGADAARVARHRATLSDVDGEAIATLAYHAPALTESEWCAAMDSNNGDWDAFSSRVERDAVSWAKTGDEMFEWVGVVVQSICPDAAATFLASTR